MLEGRVILEKVGKFSPIFPKDDRHSIKERKALSYLNADLDRQLLYAILDCPGITNRELADRFSLVKSAIHWHIRKFLKDDIIASKQDGIYKRYSIQDDVKQIIIDHRDKYQNNNSDNHL